MIISNRKKGRSVKTDLFFCAAKISVGGIENAGIT